MCSLFQEESIMPFDIPRRRGGQPGNRNARKHGYYSSVLSGPDRANLRQASEVTGLNDEIDLPRAHLKSILQHDPDNTHLISEITSALSRLMRTSYKLGFNKAENFERNRLKVLTELGRSFGFSDERILASFLGRREVPNETIRSPEK
jgi:hypothetical protein